MLDQLAGTQHGYPSCCVQDFVIDVLLDQWPGAVRNAEFPCHPNPGYVPCRRHARLLVAEHQRGEKVLYLEMRLPLDRRIEFYATVVNGMPTGRLPIPQALRDQLDRE